MTLWKDRMSAILVRYQHLWILCYFILYLAWFDYVEETVTTHFHVIHVAMDDRIPFCEYFVIPYLLWFVYIAWGVLYFAIHNKKDYYRLCGFLFTGMTVFLVISTVYPNGHYLRPVSFSRSNICTMLVDWLYSVDTATNLFPSIHVYNSLAIHIAVAKSDHFKNHPLARAISLCLAGSIILATVFLKQHSLFDVMTAFLLAAIMYLVIYARDTKSPHRMAQPADTKLLG